MVRMSWREEWKGNKVMGHIFIARNYRSSALHIILHFIRIQYFRNRPVQPSYISHGALIGILRCSTAFCSYNFNQKSCSLLLAWPSLTAIYLEASDCHLKLNYAPSKTSVLSNLHHVARRRRFARIVIYS